jgi:hypothetical protein
VIVSASTDTLAAVFAVAGVIVAVVATGLGFVQLRSARKDAEAAALAAPEQETLEQRMNALARTMHESSRLLEQVSAEIQMRQVRAEQLKAEADEAEKLAALNKEQVDAIKRVIASELSQESKKSRRREVLIGGLFFVGGVAGTVAVTLFVHPLS